MLARSLRDEIVAHARERAPEECCGLVVHLEGRQPEVVRCANVHPTPATRYRIDDRELWGTLRAMSDDERELVAIYHSHPASEPRPSATDIAEARYPSASYVLVSLRAGEPEVRAWRIEAGSVREVPIAER